MGMLPGLPLLTADQHELVDGWYTQAPPDGQGWVLVGWIALQEGPPPQKYDQGSVYLWARRRDGKPLIVSSHDADALRAEVRRLLGSVESCHQTIDALRVQVQNRDDLIADLEKRLARKQAQLDLVRGAK